MNNCVRLLQHAAAGPHNKDAPFMPGIALLQACVKMTDLLSISLYLVLAQDQASGSCLPQTQGRTNTNVCAAWILGYTWFGSILVGSHPVMPSGYAQ